MHLARAALGLSAVPPPGQPLGDVPEDWPKKAPAVRAALAELINVAVKIGLPVPPIEEDPDTVYNNFVKSASAPGGNLDDYLNQLVEKSPAVQLALRRAGTDAPLRSIRRSSISATPRFTRKSRGLSATGSRTLVIV